MVKVSGFTICRNAVRLEYPLEEVILAALPLVDEFVVNLGPSDDGTEDLLRSIPSEKIRIIHSDWDESIRKDGLLFSRETNVAISHCQGIWALYLQADEVIHEQDYSRIRGLLDEWQPDPQVLGFTFRYLHFYGDYWSTNPWGFHRAVRIIRNNGEVASCGDAVGFCLKADGCFLQSAHKNRIRSSDSTIYHYSYVKSGQAMQEKSRKLEFLYHGGAPRPEMVEALQRDVYDFRDYQIMKEFRGMHPQVMAARVSQGRRLCSRRNRWLNPSFYKAIFQKGFRG